MTNKEKNALREKLVKVKQLIMILFMLGSGIWYVTGGRAEEKKEVTVHTGPSENINKDSGFSIAGHESEEDSSDYISKVSDASKMNNTLDAQTSSREQEESGYESGNPESDTEAYKDDSSLVNLNKADLKELETIPGVGPATAKNIIEYREKYGGFADKEEIKNVKRIGDKTYEKMKEHITV